VVAKLPTTKAEKQRRYRLRQKSERAVIAVEVDLFGLTDAMIEAGVLPLENATERRSVEAAAARVLDAWKNTVTRNA